MNRLFLGVGIKSICKNITFFLHTDHIAVSHVVSIEVVHTVEIDIISKANIRALRDVNMGISRRIYDEDSAYS